MKIAVGTDHAGFPLKEVVAQALWDAGHIVVDAGTDSITPVDYPDYAKKVGKMIQEEEADRGILLCGSGVGVCIAANKIKGVYAAVCHDVYSARQGVEHDAMNVLCLGALVISPELTSMIVKAFLSARFLGGEPGQERHARRVQKIKQLENAKA